MSGEVVSESALATLTVASPILEKDTLLALVVAVAPPLQLTVVTKKKGNDLSLELNRGALTLSSRNAILRSICSMALHNRLDMAPYFLMGGNSSPSGATSSPSAALAMGAISSWMSVADTVRKGGEASSPEGLGQLLDHLDAFLATRSFLVSSPSATLADLDLYVAVVSAAGPSLADLLGKRVNVSRWLVQCQATARDLASSSSSVNLDALPSVDPTPQPVPFFFYGEEGDEAIATAAASATSGPAGGSKKQQQQAPKGGAPGGGLTDEQKKAANEERAKKKAEKAKKKGAKPQAQPAAKAPAAEIDISALDIRVGKILKAWNHEEAEKLYCEEVDVGEESGPRKIASGLRPFYKLDEMQNRTVLVLCNLKARKLVGFPSHGMVICASNEDHSKVEFAIPPDGAKIGERVVFEGYEGAPEAENKVAKKKIFEKLAPDLKTDADGIVVWKGAKSKTSAGSCKAINAMPNAFVA